MTGCALSGTILKPRSLAERSVRSTCWKPVGSPRSPHRPRSCACPRPVIGSGAVFAVIANSDFFQAEELRRQFPGAQILTCGMHQQDALTFSSFDGEQAVISLQAALVTLGGRELLPQEFPLFRREDTKRFDLLACAALLLLCGKSSQLPGITL